MSSIATDDDANYWLDLDSNVAPVTQTLDEILADNSDVFDEDLLLTCEDDDSYGLNKPASTPIPLTYVLDPPLQIHRNDVISHQVALARDRPHGGKPTCLALSATHLAVGTVRGMAIVFERQTGKLVRFMTNDNDYPTAAMTFSLDGNKLAVAYSNGSLKTFQVPSGNLVDSRDSVVQSNHGIVQVDFVSNSVLLIGDSGGSIFELREGRRRRPRCIFTGCRGEAVLIKSVRGDGLLFICTLSQVLIFDQRHGKVAAQLRLPSCPRGPPLLDWHVKSDKLTRKTTERRIWLAIGRGSEIRVHKLELDRMSITCPLIKVVFLDKNTIATSLNWVDDYNIIISTNKENIEVVDVSQGKPTSSLNTAYIEMVYNSSEYKGLHTGGNVSEALRCMAPNVCYQTVVRSDQTMFVLGQSGLFQVCLLDQMEQLDRFIKRGDVTSAVLFATDIYSGVVRDTSGEKLVRRVSSQLDNLIIELLEFAMDGLTSGRVSELVEHYRKQIAVLIKACVTTSRFDILYNVVYKRIEKDNMALLVFMESLEEFALDGRLDRPPPGLVHDFISHLINEGQFGTLENVVSRFPIETLDLHQVITVCHANKLFDGIIYVMNMALKDYVGPLEEMCISLAAFVNKGVFSDFEVMQGNKLLLYLNACLAGQAYPFGELPVELVEVVPQDIYKFMVALSSEKIAVLTGVPRFPVLRLLLDFDAQQFLNVISTCADSALFSKHEGRLERLVDLLVGFTEDRPELTHFMLPFLIQILQTSCVLPSRVACDKLIFASIDRLNRTSRSIANVEHQIVDLMLLCPELPEDEILHRSQLKPLVIVCSYVYMKRKQFPSLLEVCMSDKHHPEGVFDVIEELLSEVELVEQDQIRRFIQVHFTTLNSIDSVRTAILLLNHQPNLLCASTRLPLDLISNCFHLRRKNGFRTLCDEESDEALFCALFKGTIEQSMASGLDKHVLDKQLTELLNYWLPIGSRDDTCLNLATQSQLVQSTVVLLVARNHSERAFQLLIDSLKSASDLTENDERIALLFKLCEERQEVAARNKWWITLFYFILSKESANGVLPRIVERCGDEAAQLMDALLSHPAVVKAPYRSVYDIIAKMLVSCRVDQLIMTQSLRCVESDGLHFLASLSKSSHSPHAPLVRSNSCVYCDADLVMSFLVFSCGHVAHSECADENGRTCLCTSRRVLSHRPALRDYCDDVRSAGRGTFETDNLKLRPGPDLEDLF